MNTLQQIAQCVSISKQVDYPQSPLPLFLISTLIYPSWYRDYTVYHALLVSHTSHMPLPSASYFHHTKYDYAL